jgi:hypothetical protein
MKGLWKLLSVVLLTGCATFGQLEEGLNSLIGKPDSEAFAVLGYPSSKQEFGNDTVYTWYENRSGTMFIPQVATTRGHVGYTPVAGTTTYTQAVPVNYNCQIKLIAGGNGILKQGGYSGNIGGCTPYINLLNTYREATNTHRLHMECRVTADCGIGRRCRSREGGGTECRAGDAVPMECQVDSDCDHGQSCRYRKGGGNECRAMDR